ncbi:MULTISPECIES: WhiB family transcriptional regulator [unclassified Streptomyces]|uniref:WhiB family transcriptional regulator n=1 Tax=unclassified Streptomyces TaxID=2593676 RepID=UPI000FFE6F59|nr:MULTISPECIES: WhiB family transcriptional regulator [unclassified Streptomyces]
MAYTGAVPDTGPHRLDWMARMACASEDPDLFFDKARTHEARLVCVVRCPVRQECLANVKQLESGASREQRDGVVAGLAHNERWRLDTDVPRYKGDAEALAIDGTEACGTHLALMGHLWRGEQVDPTCWSAEIRRDRLERVSAARARQQATAAFREAPDDLKTAS